MEYLGHIVLAYRVKENPKNIQYMREWSVPQDLRDLGFLRRMG